MVYKKFKEQFNDVDMKFNEPLKHYSYTETGGPGDVLVFPKTIDQVERLVQYAHQEKIPLTVIGNASNLIIREAGIQGIVLVLTKLCQVKVEGEKLLAEAGAGLIQASQLATEHHLTGLEFACGIPGSLGGAIFMNAGAYGGEMSHIVESIEVITQAGELKTIPREALHFSYRHSVVRETGDVVVRVTMALSKGNISEIKETVATLTELRENRQPLELPSCGSVFKRPEGLYPGALIQKAGLQGFQIGGAQVSTKHAGFIVNVDHATASDYLAVIQAVQKKVAEEFAVELQPEVLIIGRETANREGLEDEETLD